MMAISYIVISFIQKGMAKKKKEASASLQERARRKEQNRESKSGGGERDVGREREA